MKLTYLGHSAVLIEEGNFKGLIDPFIRGNPVCKVNVDELVNITHIFVTHGHHDHVGDTIEIAKRNNSLIITNYELANYFSRNNVKSHGMHIGGKNRFDFGTVKLINAVHGSGIVEGESMLYGGNPCGFLIDINGKKVYHAGDTGLTLDMKLLEYENIDVAFLPIGGNYTMDTEDAAIAASFIKAKKYVPIHYNTFELVKTNPLEFKNKVVFSEVIILSANENLII